MISSPLLHPHIHTSACAVRLLCLMYSFRLRGATLPANIKHLTNALRYILPFVCRLPFFVQCFSSSVFLHWCVCELFFVTCSCALLKKTLPPAKKPLLHPNWCPISTLFLCCWCLLWARRLQINLICLPLNGVDCVPLPPVPSHARPVRLYNFGSNWISNDRDRHTTHKHWRLFSKHSPRGTYLSISSANGEEAVTFKQQQTPHCRHPVIPPHLHSHTIPLSLFKHGLFTTDRPGTRSDAFDFSWSKSPTNVYLLGAIPTLP